MFRPAPTTTRRTIATAVLTAVALLGSALLAEPAVAAPTTAAPGAVVAAPTVTAAAPASGTVGGGTTVTVTGTGFTGATAVRFGATPAASFTVRSDTRLTATTRAGNLGAVDVRITTPAGTSAVTTTDRYTFVGGYFATSTIEVGSSPTGVAADPVTHTAYVAEDGQDTIAVVDLATRQITSRFDVPAEGGGSGRSPNGAAGNGFTPELGALAVDPSLRTLYALDTANDQLLAVDEAEGSVDVRVDVATSPVALAVDPDSGLVVVVSTDGTVSVFDGVGIVTTFDVGAAAAGVTVDPGTGLAYVTDPTGGTLTVVDLAALRVTATVRVGAGPTGVAVEPVSHTVYVANRDDGSIAVVRGTAVVSTFAAPGVDRLVIDPTTRTLYSGASGGTVRVIDPGTRRITATVTVPGGVDALAVDPTLHAALAVTTATDTLAVLQPGNPPLLTGLSPTSGSVSGGRIVTIIGSGFTGAKGVLFGGTRAPSFTVLSATRITAVAPAGTPGAVAVRVVGLTDTSPATGAARFTHTGRYLTTATPAVENSPVAVTVDPASGTVWVVNGDNDSVSFVDTATATVTGRVGTGFTPAGVAVDPTTGRAVVTDSAQFGLTVYQGRAPIELDEPVQVDGRPTAVAVDPGLHEFYVLLPASDRVVVFDAGSRTVTSSVAVGRNPNAIAVDPTTHRVYVLNQGDATLSVIDGRTDTVVDTVGFPIAPSAVAVDPTTDTLYLTFATLDQINLSRGTTGQFIARVSVAGHPVAVAVDPVTHAAFVVNGNTGDVTVVDGTTRAVVTTVDVGDAPVAVAVDPVTHAAFVTNSAANTVSVIRAADAPTVAAVAPAEGSFLGGQRVTITGTDLTGASAVTFGGVAAPAFTVVSPTRLVAVAPAGTRGFPVDIRVTTPFGTSAVTPADEYTYVDATPTLSTTPSPGVAAGGALSTTLRVTGGSTPHGGVVFDLFGPSAPQCTGEPVSRIFAELSTRTVRSGPITVTVAGTYRWRVTYQGDSDNNAVTTPCGDATVVTPGPLDHLVLSPGRASIAAGTGQTYVVTAFDRFDNRRGAVTASSTLTIAGGGSCTGATCSSTVVGVHTVTATSGGLTATATLRVT